MQTRLKNSLRLVWFVVAFLFFVVMMPTGHVSQADSSVYGTDMLPYMGTSTPTIANGSNPTMISQMGSATPFNIPLQALYASNIRGAGTSNVAAIDTTTAGSKVTVVLKSGSYPYPFKKDGDIDYSDLGAFSFVFSLGNGDWIDMKDACVKVGAGDPDNAVKRTSTETGSNIEIGKDSSSGDAMYLDNGSLVLPQDIYVQIDLQEANAEKNGYLAQMSAMTISEQVSLRTGYKTTTTTTGGFLGIGGHKTTTQTPIKGYDGTTWFKTVIGALPFKITLNPQVSHITYLPKPITTKGSSTGAIITGTGSIAGDTIEYSLDDGNTWASTGAKVTDGNTWLWLVPESLGLSENDHVLVRETDTAKDDSTTDGGTVVNPFAGMTDTQITVEEGKIADIINNGGDVDEITQQINDVLTDVTATQTATTQGYSLKMTKVAGTGIQAASDIDFLFTNGYKDADNDGSETTIATTGLGPVANSAFVSMRSKLGDNVDFSQLGDSKIDWSQLTTSGQAFPDIDGQQPLEITTDTTTSNAGAMVAANDNYVYQMKGAPYAHGVTVVLVGKFTVNGKAMQVTKTIHIIALKPEKTDFEYGSKSSFTFSLTDSTDSLADATYAWQYAPKDSQDKTTLLPDESNQSLTIGSDKLTYFNEGDTYQLQITMPDDETYYSNPVALEFVHDEPLSFLKVPDLHFSYEGGGISLESALNGWKKYDPNATSVVNDVSHDTSWTTHELSADESNSDFQIMALNDTPTKWSVSASLAPFVNTTTGNQLNPGGGTAALYLDFNTDTARGMKLSQVSDYSSNEDGTIASDYRKQPVYDDNQDVTVLSSYGDNIQSNFALMTKVSAKLDIASSPYASSGTYASTLTWTLTNAPQ